MVALLRLEVAHIIGSQVGRDLSQHNRKRQASSARSQSHACARARSPIPLAIGRGETIADIVQREFKVCLVVFTRS